MNTAVHFSSATPEHATPQDFFDKLNAQYNFTLDPCATAENAKCKKFYTRDRSAQVRRCDSISALSVRSGGL